VLILLLDDWLAPASFHGLSPETSLQDTLDIGRGRSKTRQSLCTCRPPTCSSHCYSWQRRPSHRRELAVLRRLLVWLSHARSRL